MPVNMFLASGNKYPLPQLVTQWSLFSHIVAMAISVFQVTGARCLSQSLPHMREAVVLVMAWTSKEKKKKRKGRRKYPYRLPLM